MNPSGNKVILLVEDEAILAMASIEKIKSFGYEIRSALTGEKAVDLVAADPSIDLVLMDIDLGGGMDGSEAAARILRSRILPVVFLTSHFEREMVEKVRGIKRYGYVIKDSGDFVLRSSIEMAFELFEAQEAAQNQGDKFRLLFQNMAVDLAAHDIILDGEGRPVDYRFLEANPAFDRLTGLEASKIIGRTATEVLPLIDASWIDIYGKVALDELEGRRCQNVQQSSFRAYIDAAPMGVFVVDGDRRLVLVNPATSAISGYGETELIGMNISQLLAPDQAEAAAGLFARLEAEGRATGEFAFLDKVGRRLCWSVNAARLSPTRYVGFLQDVTERRQSDKGLLATVELFELIRESGGRNELMKKVLQLLRRLSGCEAVGIRLREGDDFPYYVLEGFPDDFVRTENSLCTSGDDGELLRDEIGNPVLECMCGNVIRGRFDPSLPFFTAHGSFCTNSTTGLLASSTEADRQARTRNRCNGEGFESVALIPLRSGGSTYGLIQLNDRRRDMFPPHAMPLFERLADSLSYALSERIAKDRLKESEERYSSLIRTSMDGFWVADISGRIVDVNEAYCRMTGYSRESLLQLRISDLDSIENTPEAVQIHTQRISRAGNDRFESRHRRADGTVFDVEVSAYLHQTLGFFLAFIRDITVRKENEGRIAKLLQEKEMLMREVQHRVKNNLNTMESLLSIQAEYAKDPSTALVLREAQTRLRSMGLLYDKLYRSESIGNLPVGVYLPALVDEILAVFPNPGSVRAETVTDDLVLPMKTLSSLGILMNELITNTMKHAFAGKVGGMIRISALHSGGRATFSVEDNGVGIPEGVDFATTTGLGLRLVRLLADQLNATVRIERGQGSRVIVEFATGEES